MATTFQVAVVSPESVVWAGEAEFVAARTTEGDIGILADHEPTMAALATGSAVIHLPGGDEVTVAVHGGFLQIFQSQVTLLSDRAEIAEGDRESAAERAAELRSIEEASRDDSEPGPAGE